MPVILYVDTSEVRAGALEELKQGIKGLVDFVEANEPQLIAYNVYFREDGTRMTVVSLHPDSASLEYHLEVAGPHFRRFVELVTSPRSTSTANRARRCWSRRVRRHGCWAAAQSWWSRCTQVSLVSRLASSRERPPVEVDLARRRTL
jgi:hypothetical protein